MIDRIEQLQEFTKSYFFESNDFFFSKKYISLKKKSISLVYSAYNLEYNLVLKDYKIFFENKLKERFCIDTKLHRTSQKKRFIINKYSYKVKVFRGYRFYDKNFDLGDIGIRSNIVFNFNVKIRKRQLTAKKFKCKTLTKKFFYSLVLQNDNLKKLEKKVKI